MSPTGRLLSSQLTCALTSFRVKLRDREAWYWFRIHESIVSKRRGKKAATLCSILFQSLEGRRASVLPREDTVHAPV